MNRLSVEIERGLPELRLYGVHGSSIGQLMRRYYSQIDMETALGTTVYIVSRTASTDGSRAMFLGGETARDGFEDMAVPGGTYARITVRPYLGFIWSAAISSAKRRFFRRWLPRSGYAYGGVEYERHAEETTSRRPALCIYFLLQ